MNKTSKSAIFVLGLLLGCDSDQSSTTSVPVPGGPPYADAGMAYDASAISDASAPPDASTLGNCAPPGKPIHARAQHSAAPLVDGTVLILGGMDESGFVAEAEIYEPGSGIFSPAGSLNVSRRLHTTTVVPGGKVLVVGGFDGNINLASAELFDPLLSAFSNVGPMIEPRTEHAAAVLADGRVLVVGGWRDGVYLSSAELYDPVTQKFYLTGSLHTARSGHAATLLKNGRVLISGGDNLGPVATAEVFDPTTGSFQELNSSMVAPRFRHEAVRLEGGLVLLVGGFGGADVVELYDPSAQGFVQTKPMSTWRSFHRAVALPNGNVVVAGGQNLDGDLASSECFGLKSHQFTPATSMAVARRMHSATLVCGNEILIVGGEVNGVPIHSAERLVPPLGCATKM